MLELLASEHCFVKEKTKPKGISKFLRTYLLPLPPAPRPPLPIIEKKVKLMYRLPRNLLYKSILLREKSIMKSILLYFLAIFSPKLNAFLWGAGGLMILQHYSKCTIQEIYLAFVYCFVKLFAKYLRILLSRSRLKLQCNNLCRAYAMTPGPRPLV